jgi:hypothetical protein
MRLAGTPGYWGTVGSAQEGCLADRPYERTHQGETMTLAQDMLETYPKDLGGIDRDALTACIEACFECAQACTACADACLSEEHPHQPRLCRPMRHHGAGSFPAHGL